MYLSIIPFSHSIGASPLTYVGGDIFHSKIQLGSIVEIPFGKIQEHGLVVGISEENLGDIQELKSITSIITSKSIIAPYQIDLIISIARRYMIPIHRVLGFFLTRPILSRLEKYGYDTLQDEILPPSTPNIEQKHKLIFSTESIITPNILEKYIKEGTVIICPDDFSLENYRSSFENEGTLFLTSEATDVKKAKAWIDIRNGKYKQIFGSRRLLYYNLAHYRHIIYLEDAFGKEYFHFPSRIHYLDVLFFLEKSHHFSMEILTSIPLLSTLARAKHFDIINHS